MTLSSPHWICSPSSALCIKQDYWTLWVLILKLRTCKLFAAENPAVRSFNRRWRPFAGVACQSWRRVWWNAASLGLFWAFRCLGSHEAVCWCTCSVLSKCLLLTWFVWTKNLSALTSPQTLHLLTNLLGWSSPLRRCSWVPCLASIGV
jgi:hypothetical protein